MAGLDATMKMLDAVEDLIVVGGAVLEDGKVSFKDIVYVREAVADLNVLVGQGKAALAEMKDLDQVEVAALITKLLEVVEKAADVFKPAA